MGTNGKDGQTDGQTDCSNL